MPRIVAVAPANCSVTSDKTVIDDNGTDTVTYTITVRDTDNDVVNGEIVYRPMQRLARTGNIVLGGTTGLTITWLAAETDVDGQIQFTATSTTAATYTITVSVLGQALTQTPVLTVTGDPPPPPPEFFVEDWDYSSTANMASNPNGWFEADSISHPTLTRIELTTGLTTPWGGTKAVRNVFDDCSVLTCSDEVTVGKNILIPGASKDNLREMWLEFYIRFSSNFAVTFSCNSFDLKTLFITQKRKEPEGLNYRWRFSTGNGALPEQPMVFNDPNSGVTRWLRSPAGSTNENDDMSTQEFLYTEDEAWHRCRAHVKLSSAFGVADGEFQFWIGSTQGVNVTGYQSAGDAVGGSRPVVDEFFQRIALGRNMNERPEQAQWYEFGKITIWNSNPNWTF